MTGSTVHIPTLRTGRLVLRAPKIADFDAYADFRGSDRAKGVGGPNARGDAWEKLTGIAGQWVLRGYGRWIMADPETDAALGVVGIYHPDDWPEAEIGWSVFAPAEGKGLAYEAALASRRYAYETLGFPTIVSLVAAGNSRSVALAERMKATPDGHFDHPAFGRLTIWRHLAPEAVQ